MAASDAPTGTLGSLSGGWVGGAWGAVWDVTESVSELLWPASNFTYSRMRRDPVLASILAAYTLPITRARWAVDPRGASARMARICADSLDLPLIGKDDPGPVRRRGVRWREHLRLVVNGTLIWGHMPFVPSFEINSDGDAVLATLEERMPASIHEIEIDDGGHLRAVWQDGFPSNDPRGVRIPKDRMIWHARDREGSNWVGRSIFRPAYGPWLLKQDALRVHATSIRRFGAGTPIAKPLAGTAPTHAQMVSAQDSVSNIRVGDSGGAVLPPGFDANILGVQGTMPDGVSFARYLDEQMARQALTSVLDLGNTANGSRALGSVFADILADAIQLAAEQIAETDTELCAWLTDFNEGPDAKVPAVVVTEAGRSRDILAEAIAGLISSGAITPDEDLEAWIRDAYGAPVRRAEANPAPAPQGDENGGEPGAGQDEPTSEDDAPEDAPAEKAPKKATARRVRAAVTVDEPRDLTPAEQAAGLDPAAADDAHAQVLAALLAAWVLISGEQRDSLLGQIGAAAGVGALAALTLDATDAAEVIGAGMLDAADRGQGLALAEATWQGADAAPDPVDVDAVQAMASAIADVMGQSTSAAAAREALRLAGEGADMDTVAAGVGEHLDGLSNAWVEEQLGGAVAAGMNEGRGTVLRRGTRWFASEVRDRATCTNCLQVDGTQFGTWQDALTAYPTGGYRDCKGRLRCRGLLVAIYGDRSDARNGPIPSVEVSRG